MEDREPYITGGNVMKCPYCEYVCGWNAETSEVEDGGDGDFWRLPIKMERAEYYLDATASLFACPKCKKTFIDEFC